jgi:hypothetical protein
MNTRIQEIAHEAGLPTYNPQGIPTKLSKFAELLICECIQKIELEAAQYAEPVWAFELVNDIKEHFGVAK